MTKRLFELTLAFLLPCAAWALVFCLPTLPFGSRGAAELLGVVALFVGVAALCIPFVVLGALVSSQRVQLLRVLGILAVIVVGGFLGVSIGRQLRMRAFESLAARSHTHVKAIQRYEHEQGAPPSSLEDLTPHWLDAVPTTGMGGYPDYEYFIRKDSARFEGNPWVLRVEAFGPGMKWDTFLYFPNQNYPKFGYGGRLEKVDGWAYVHE